MSITVNLTYKDDIWFAKNNSDYIVHADYGNDFIMSKGGNDTLYGFDGNDKLFGGAGNDYLHGGIGIDLMTGGTGNDKYFVDDVKDQVLEYNEPGADTVATTLEKYTLGSFVDDLELIGQNDAWGIGNGFNNKITGNAWDNLLDGKDGNDTLYGMNGIDTLFGGKGDDALNGGSGDDKMFGGEDKDELFGGFGDDLLHGGAGADTIYGSVGYDTASYASSSAGVQIFLDTNGTSGGDAIGDKLYAIEAIIGSGHNDWLSGDQQDNILTGDAGRDRLVGLDGNDTLLGGQGKDTLEGGAGADKLTGGTGADKLEGGTGHDTFIFEGVHGIDTILDFEDGADKIWMSDTVFSDLQFVASNSDTMIIQEDTSSVIWLKNIDPAHLSQTDFLFL